MKVFECQMDGMRCLVAVDRKYLKISTKAELLGLDEILSIDVGHLEISITLNSKNTHKLTHLDEDNFKMVQEIVKSRRMINNDEISDAIKKNIQLQNTYKNINEKEHKIFYRIFGEMLLKNVKSQGISQIEQRSSSEKAKFLMSNRIVMNAFFNLNITFRLFVNHFYNGYLMTSASENEVDVEIFRILNRPISLIERVNVRSMLLLDTPPEKKELVKEKPKPAKKDHLINPDLVKLLSETTPSLHTENNLQKIDPIVLTLPKFTVSTIAPMKRVGVPADILRRMKEISKLIYKNKSASDDLEEVSNNLQQFLKDEIRRKLPIDEGNAVIAAIGRIIPSRFLNHVKNQSSK
ncbi:uncharacterized protein NEPG_00161 [Nematocida parisii ERTm1]|uniref:Uncharacterized protein n=1 Tax=Nematocida parisii (strain ERTm3) TaxID=935791 RepID=I3EGN9_NEMP3|nr:uncharacterized protein NEPG_00161 [Nematocida parisii ERTm1]EIJ88386.1 hypothetical protein NEQG_01076 [Nematocida parisii ERTm3]KAI5129786.1 hypothetical protein NEPAR03_1821 [Nematocida parisii]EIJ94639.1 hypothetical protein NEPG_00161 [Nematocida parisii ERTm1]KAI5129981.1 hypothetical protein NEPAR08_1800 [Nematocida parisii]KAI5145974.1 hypothetical protein NEPAR07_2000 [Nematocida parisii]|eukprot:XP_013057995.1 hypothetical protein NEPG_00161 [Nematocida parisii ERTm1]